MNYQAIKKNDLLQGSDLDRLSVFEDRIKQLRRRLYDYAEKLPSPLNETLTEHYNTRLKSTEGKPMLGEYAAFLIGGLYDINISTIMDISYPWLLLYEYCLLLDDIIDKNNEDLTNKILLSQMLLNKSRIEFKRIIGQTSRSWESFDIHFEEWIYAMLHELNLSKNEHTEFKPDNIIEQGRKASVVKFCASCILRLSNNRDLSPVEKVSLDNICAGIQLLDDLDDYLEDHAAGRKNFLLLETYRWLENNHTRNSQISLDELRFGMIYSGSLERTWSLASSYIMNGISKFENKHSDVYYYFSNLALECQNSCNTVCNILKSAPTPNWNLENRMNKKVECDVFDINQKVLDNFSSNILLIIERGPKAAN